MQSSKDKTSRKQVRTSDMKNVLNQTKKQYTIVKTDDDGEKVKMTLADIQQINTDVKAQLKKGDRFIIRGLNAAGWRTLKGFGTELDIDEVEDYYVNKVKSTTKFKDFYQVQVTTFRLRRK